MILENRLKKFLFNNSEKIKINSKEIKKGDVFVALKGNKTHGNKYIKASINNGAKFCITDKKLNIFSNNNNIFFVSNIYLFLEEIAKHKIASFKGKVIGITGSSGKTTLKETLSFFLKKKYKTYSSIKSYNNFLGVLISIINMNLNSKFAIFELGTNNFGEIAKLTSLVKPSQVFITNIHSTHLENFKNKKNISIEKSDIFISKYNPRSKILFLNNTNFEEKMIVRIAKKEKLKIVSLGDSTSNYYVKEIIKKNNFYYIYLFIKNKLYKLISKDYYAHRINNFLFCLAFYKENNLDIRVILKNFNKLLPVEGRGRVYNLSLNNFRSIFIDETYNANPDTMIQSVENFANIEKKHYSKLLILGNMNELGKSRNKLHLEVIKFVEKYRFDKVILCGEFYKLAINKIKKPRNKYIIKFNSNQLLDYVKKNIYSRTIIMAKCSNVTEVNKFASKLIIIGGRN